MLIESLLVFTLFGQVPAPSAFDAYASHLEPRVMRVGCRLQDQSYFRNLTYPFRAKAYPGQRSLRFGLVGGSLFIYTGVRMPTHGQ